MKVDVICEDGTITVASHDDDVSKVLDRNKELRTIEQPSDWGRHVASIPAIILVKWLNEAWMAGHTSVRALGSEFDALVERKLKDPEWAYLRTDCKTSMVGHGS